MLTLEDPCWSTIRHAYGPASNIPDLLRQLAASTEPTADYRIEPWFSLWSALCHQGDIFEASYAALPHIVDIACSAKGRIDNSFFQLPAAIEVARSNGSGPLVPSGLEDSYARGLTRLQEAVILHRHESWDQDTLISAICVFCSGSCERPPESCRGNHEFGRGNSQQAD